MGQTKSNTANCLIAEDSEDGLDNLLDVKERSVTVAVLGTRESGKTTLFNQISLSYSRALAELQEEKLRTQRTFVKNFLSYLSAIYKKFGSVTDDQNIKNILEIEFSPNWSTFEFDRVNFYGFNNNMLTLIENIWNSAKGKEVWAERYENSFLIPEGIEHFCENLDRFGDQEYVLKKEDYLKRYNASMGLNEFDCIADNTKIKFIEVGGTKSERRKWILASGDSDIIYFLVSTADFNHLLYENHDKTRLEDSIEAWKNFQGMKMFRNQSKILIFTKVDLLEKKVEYFLKKNISLKQYFCGLEYDETDSVEMVKCKILNWYQVEFLKVITKEENIPHIFINTLDKTVVDDIFILTKRDILQKEFLNLN